MNDWIIVGEKQGDTDPVVTWNGGYGNCTWCGETDNTAYVMTQIVQVTSVSGNTIGISRPLYYTFKSSLSPNIMKLTIPTQKAGIESIKLWGSTNSRSNPHIDIDGCAFCWLKDVETYNTPDVAKAYPILMQYSYGNEVRDSYFHYGQGNARRTATTESESCFPTATTRSKTISIGKTGTAFLMRAADQASCFSTIM